MPKPAEEIIEDLKQGNKDYANGKETLLGHEDKLRLTTLPQKPKAIVVSCIDSRVPVELIFNQSVGDLFVARVAGNIMNEDIVGSIEFALLLNKVKVVVILGHTSCGAMQGACNQVKLGKLTQLLEKIEPAVSLAKREYDKSDYTSSEFVDFVAKKNTLLTAERLRSLSPQIADFEKQKKVIITSALYNMETQRVAFFDKEEE